ncbi:GntR family transcriptional regulator [Bradyrhizobium sp. dw_78]|uniref:GntR family transcriptional regulator n=1 Tax=Bradyrhizobium sp. dw_78 TaxID=2719793 RepID=UPI001BD5855D|nr:GntR family transcriptional regulator [Bradyrhizobium sp. dw_78]
MRPESLGEQAYNRLIEMMLAGEFRPGTILQERGLASILNVSRTPLREALGRLANKGLIAREAGRFVMVDGLDVQRLVETFSLRRLLETEFAGLAAGKVAKEQIEHQRARAHEFLALPSPSPGDYWNADNALHSLIADAAGNEFAASLALDVRRLTHVLVPHRTKDQIRSGVMEHFAIMDAVLAGDALRSRELMEEHLAGEKSAGLASALGDPIEVSA